MGNYSKLIATVVGFILSFAVAKLALPAEWASPEVAASIASAISAILVFVFPANNPAPTA